MVHRDSQDREDHAEREVHLVTMVLLVVQASRDHLVQEENEVSLELLEKLDHQDPEALLDQEESEVKMVRWVHQVVWDQLDRED